MRAILSCRFGRLPAALLLLLPACEQGDAPDDNVGAARHAEPAVIRPAAQAIDHAHIPTLDPATMVAAEIDRALQAGSWCTFRYTTAGRPVFALLPQPTGAPSAVVKLNGDLVLLAKAPGEAWTWQADPVRLTLVPDAAGAAPGTGRMARQEANLVFEVGDRLKVGYRGYYACAG